MSVRVFVRAEYVRIFLAKKNYNAGWLAGKLGVSRAYLSEVLSNRKAASAPLRQRMMAVLQAKSWETLFRFDDGTES